MAVADGGLRLDGEEEGRDEAVDVVDTWRPRLVLQVVQIAPWEDDDDDEEESVRERGRGEGGVDKEGVKKRQ